MSATTDSKGLKRICTSCGTRFYDMNKRPIVCPSCNAEFTGDVKPKSRRIRPAEDEGQVSEKTSRTGSSEESDDDEDMLDEDDDTVSLDDLEDEDGADTDDDNDDIDLDGDLDLDDLDDDINDDDDNDDDLEKN